MKLNRYLVLLSATLLLPLSAVAKETEVDSTTLCMVNGYNVSENLKKCEKGTKIAYLPQTFGNEQLPIMFVAGHCDLRYTVSLTTGGVVCVFNPVEQVIQK